MAGIFESLKSMFSWKKSQPMVNLSAKEMLLIQANYYEWGYEPNMTTMPENQYRSMIEQGFFNNSLSESFGNVSKGNSPRGEVAAALAVMYTTAEGTRQQLMARIDEVKDFYIVDVIVDQLCNDSLNPDITTGEVLKLSSKKPAIRKELEMIEEKFNLDELVKSILPELIYYGEYTLSTAIKVQNQKAPENLIEAAKDKFDKLDAGLIELNDNVKQTDVLAVTKNNKIAYYLASEDTPNGKEFAKVHKSSYVQFSLNSKRVRVDLHKEFSYLSPKERKEISKLPRFVRVGKSMLFPLVDKLHELLLLEKLIPAAKLSKLSSGTILGLSVPPGYDLKKARTSAQNVESIINREVVVNPETKRVELADILASVGRVKVIPLMGDKGQTQVLETQSDEPDDLTSDADSLRKLILDSVGIPYELIFSSDGDSKADILKRYSRYLRKLKAIQSALSRGVKQIAKIHLGAKGIPFDDEDIQVDFVNKLVELENLDKLEFASGSIALLDDIKDFVESLIDSGFEETVNTQEFAKYLQEQFRLIGLEDIISAEKMTKSIKGDDQNSKDLSGKEDDELKSPKEKEPKDDNEDS